MLLLLQSFMVFPCFDIWSIIPSSVQYKNFPTNVFFFFLDIQVVRESDMSGSLKAGWSFPLGHKCSLQFTIRQHMFVIVMENTFKLKMNMDCDHWDGTIGTFSAPEEPKPQFFF